MTPLSPQRIEAAIDQCAKANMDLPRMVIVELRDSRSMLLRSNDFLTELTQEQEATIADLRAAQNPVAAE